MKTPSSSKPETSVKGLCYNCRHWRREWAENAHDRGGCAKSRNGIVLTILSNLGRWERLGWMETPGSFGCVLWQPSRGKSKPKPTP